MPRKILGLELLRGLCALLVAIYHGLYWTGIARFPSWGRFGVYVFFVISGAVLYQNYHKTLSLHPAKPGDLSIPQFLLKRFARLAPLLWACILVPAIGRNSWIPDQYFLNLSLLFGFGAPGQTSYLTGGWSIGIEFVLYALFPVLLAFARDARTMVVTLLLLLGLRMIFVSFVLKGTTLAEAWAIYTEPAAFLVFFFGGMVVARTMATVTLTPVLGLAMGCLCALLMFADPGSSDAQILLGARGLLLTTLSLFVVAAFFWSPPQKLAAVVSRFFGDVSYGLYLMHPLVWAAARRYLPPMPDTVRIIPTIAVATIAAWFSLRFYERPLRGWILSLSRRPLANSSASPML
jgi:peptidoglycan/LPS O-acetylase OafA/YrhL